MAEPSNKLRKKISIFKVFMFFITLSIVPLIVLYSSTPMTAEDLLFLTGESREDMFSYYKSWAFAVCTAILGLNSLWDFVADNLSFDYKKCLKNPIMVGFAVVWILILVVGIANNLSGGGPAPSNQMGAFLLLMIVYGGIFIPHVFITAFPGQFSTHIPRVVAIASMVFFVVVLATTAVTEFRNYTFSGAIERCETVFVVLGYIIICLEIMSFAAERLETTIIFCCLMISAAVIGVIGFFQLIGMDFFYTDIANKMVLGEYYDAGIRLSPRMNEAYATLYNPNCVGMYSSMLGPLMLGAGIFWPRKSPIKYLLLGASVFGFICLLGSNSTGGLTATVVALGVLVLLILCNFIYNKRNVKIVITVVGAAIVVVAGSLMIPTVNSKLMTMANKLLVIKTDEERGYRDFWVEGNKAILTMPEDKILTISFIAEGSRLMIQDSQGNEVEATAMEETEEGSGVIQALYEIEDWPQFVITIDGASFSYDEGVYATYFSIDDQGNIWALGRNGVPLDLESKVPSIGFENYQRFASSRGYIWSKTIPMMLDSLVIGKGVDSYLLSFPQNDIRGKANFFSNPYIIVDKPHNAFMQTAVNTGFISLLAHIVIFCAFLWTAFKVIIKWKNLGDTYFATLVGVFAGVTGYLVSALATDSTVSVTPTFWAVLGLGFACINGINRLVKEENIQ